MLDKSIFTYFKKVFSTTVFYIFTCIKLMTTGTE
jgi:hypothetical protein